MQRVAIKGIGQTPVREHWDMAVHNLAVDAARAALDDAGIDKVDAIFLGNMTSDALNKQHHLATKVADYLGMRGVETVKLEAACGSGAAAVRQGMLAIAGGMMDAVLVVGVEKMTDSKGAETTRALATAADADYEVIHGVTFVGLNALVMQRYMHTYGYVQADFAPFALNAHANGANNPNALFREPISLRTYERGRAVAEPITLFDASPIGDGAAAVVLVSAEKAPDAVKILGSASSIDTLAVHDREDPLWLKAAEISTRKAMAQAGVTHDDIDIFELHDAFSVMAALSLESSGFVEPGQGVPFAQSGAIFPNGGLPIQTMGGLKARGHPVGATGVYQIVEATQQMRGTAGDAQIDGVEIAMTQNIGGSGATIVTHILGK
ncbi:MAG: thiolase domain-containing protein [Anaerolineae bacterium]|nr:thiolase domain-containing protein [Anaerolineae bacterium]MCO5190028.1 thiolase domain-containing protein [Anaerolineae bacterium]MCO5196826.1 thiolase domain-containing protein [Anaerolineae bacterium]MCO5207832.1 thiolase domain-containing protein [Anaerolineae bacterium]